MTMVNPYACSLVTDPNSDEGVDACGACDNCFHGLGRIWAEGFAAATQAAVDHMRRQANLFDSPPMNSYAGGEKAAYSLAADEIASGEHLHV